MISTKRDQPGKTQVPITPSDDTVLDINCLYCLTAGDAVLQGLEGTSVTYAMTAGQLLPFGPQKVMAASTGTYVGWR